MVDKAIENIISRFNPKTTFAAWHFFYEDAL